MLSTTAMAAIAMTTELVWLLHQVGMKDVYHTRLTTTARSPSNQPHQLAQLEHKPDPIQLSAQYGICFLRFWHSAEQWTKVCRHCRGTVPYMCSMKQWVEKADCITQQVRLQTTRTAAVTNRRHSLVGSVLGFCVISHCSFSAKALFLSTSVRMGPPPPPKSHFN